jgi:DNA-directed RNA polymerase specialized sigma24 family protein
VAMFTTANPEVEATNRDKIKYLKRYINLDREIDRKLEEVARLRSKLTRVTEVFTAEPKGGGSIYGKTEEILAKIVDMEREIDADVDRLISIRDNIKAIIEAVEDDRERLLLQYRYLDGRTFEEIAVQMHYSWRQIHRLHSKALTNLKMS